MADKPKYETNVVKPNLCVMHKEVEHRMIKVEDETSMDNLVKDLNDFMVNNIGRGQSDEVKDKLYSDAIEKWKQLRDHLIGVHYNFYLNRKQYQWLTDTLMTKLEYNSDTVFLALELTEMLGEWKETGTNKDDDSLKGYVVDATELNYIYHLLADKDKGYKVTGLTAQAYRFREVLTNIFKVLKVVSYYDNHVKSLQSDIQNWVALFEENMEGVGIEGKEELTVKKDKSKKVEA
jgi:hypothetical protein